MDAAEFQNAIFAGAAKIVTEFCIIVRKDGKIVYIDSDYKAKILMGNKSNITIDTLYNNGIITKKDLEKIKTAISKDISQNITFNVPTSALEKEQLKFALKPIGVTGDNIENRSIKLAVDPITRPSGYFLLEAPKEDKKTSAEDKKMDLLNKFVIGSFAINKEGEFSELDPLLEKALGYSAGEVTSLGITFSDLFYDEDTVLKMLSNKDNWQAILLLRNKENMIVSSLVDYNVVKSKNGNIVKSYGFITPFSEVGGVLDNAGTARGGVFDLVNNSPIATAVLDMNGFVQRSNKAFRDIVEKDDIYE